MDISILNKINRETIKSAGARYTPILDPAAPNLEIEELVQAIDGLALTPNYYAYVANLRDNFKKEWDSCSLRHKGLFRKASPERIIFILNKLHVASVDESAHILKKLIHVIVFANKRIESELDVLREKSSHLESDSDEYRSFSARQNSLYRLRGEINEINSFCSRNHGKYLRKNNLLIKGSWGSGKTHFLCDLTKERMRLGLPTLFFLAHRISTTRNPLISVLDKLNLKIKEKGFLQKLNHLGKQQNTRALIIIDGINESDIEWWRKNVGSLADTISMYPYVGLILSSRSPFEKKIFTGSSAKKYEHIIHPGFSDIEFDAQVEFFKYYNVPDPSIPLLSQEFSKPLFLKLLCETLSGKTRTAKSRWFKDIASGQKGMTKILEDFCVKQGGDIENQYGLSKKTIWNLLKGKVICGQVIGIASSMAENGVDFISEVECIRLINSFTNLEEIECKKLLKSMIVGGLLADDITWNKTEMIDIVRLPYQRFSDHLIARHLLNQKLNTTSQEKISRSFYKNKPLGKVFINDRWGQLKNPGLASAIWLEFPERVKNKAEFEQELLFYLPKKRRGFNLITDTFIDGLHWRTRTSFSKGSDYIISEILKRGDKDQKYELLDALCSLACKVDHPYSSERLYKIISSMKITERDLLWSEYLRCSEDGSSVQRLLRWIEQEVSKNIHEDLASHLIRILSLCLSTSHKTLRDRSTKCLVLLGEQHPKMFFSQVIESLSFNDPYIAERMLASAYGIYMRRWTSGCKRLKQSTPNFCRKIFDAFYEFDAPYATSHILIRDYTKGIITLSRKICPHALGNRKIKNIKNVGQISKNLIPHSRNIRNKPLKEVEGALHMDFSNYTLGRIIRGRHSYQYEHKEYKAVLKQLKWRMRDLGYRDKDFKQIDSFISERNFARNGRDDSGSKIDRYGKKYSRIAYFEIAGMLHDNNKLSFGGDARISDCDIDPSFPSSPENLAVEPSDIFNRKYPKMTDWIKNGDNPNYEYILELAALDKQNGPWMALDGYLSEKSLDDSRGIFTFIRGGFVDQDNIEELEKRFKDEDYPGNSIIPDTGSDYYTFSGEVPWSENFAKGYYISSRNKKIICEAYRQSKTENIIKRKSSLNSWELNQALPTPKKSEHVLFMDEDKIKELYDSLPSKVELSVHRSIPGIKVEMPTHSLAWESYHSSENSGESSEYLAPAICQTFGLVKCFGGAHDLIDEHKNIAFKYRHIDFSGKDDYSRMSYIRRDLLEEYCAINKLRFVRMIWGERETQDNELMRSVLKVAHHQNIHKTFEIVI